jgi:hypothetical protein
MGCIPFTARLGERALTNSSDHRCEISGWFAKLLKNMVARDGVEPPTPAFSGLNAEQVKLLLNKLLTVIGQSKKGPLLTPMTPNRNEA